MRLKDFKDLTHFTSGLFLIFFYFVFAFKKERLYYACSKIYAKAQEEKGFLKQIAIGFFENQIAEKFRDYYIFKSNKEKDSLSTVAIEEYSTEDLCGYGSLDFAEIHENNAPLLLQQRSLIIPQLSNIIKEYKTVVELGTANGDVLAYLAQNFPMSSFVGVDFLTGNAQKKWRLNNLSFINGYPLELLEAGKLKGDIIFGSSTFCIFTPLELKRYFKAIKAAGFKHILLNEPSLGEHRQKDNGTFSRHCTDSIWFHNWSGYLKESGFQIKDMYSFHYKHNKSKRPDITMTLVHAIT